MAKGPQVIKWKSIWCVPAHPDLILTQENGIRIPAEGAQVPYDDWIRRRARDGDAILDESRIVDEVLEIEPFVPTDQPEQPKSVKVSQPSRSAPLTPPATPPRQTRRTLEDSNKPASTTPQQRTWPRDDKSGT